MQTRKTYDIIGIGIGPFNLGMAALANDLPLQCLFFDDHQSFNWHPGLLLDEARLQVPFFADLVTIADPCNKFSYLNYLHAKKRMFRFAIHENNYPTRKEFNDYCQWVASQLKTLQFGYNCEAVHFDAITQLYKIFVRETASQTIFVFWTRYIVIGVGSIPHIPWFAEQIEHPFIFHSGQYLYKKPYLLDKKSITVVGSGQSAAEIFYDLLQCYPVKQRRLTWITRAERFSPMDYSKLTLEMTSPGYIDYFYGLSADKKQQVLCNQQNLYKAINQSLLAAIYDRLYILNLDTSPTNVHLQTCCALHQISIENDGQIQASFHQTQTSDNFLHGTSALILATGYAYHIPSFLEPVKELIRWTDAHLYDVQRNYSIDKKGNTIFVQNAESQTHGFNAADLGMGPYRNAVILNTILGTEHFTVETNIAFQQFGNA